MVSQDDHRGLPELMVLNGPMANHVVPLQGPALIVGRDFNTNVRFDSEYLSGQHARLDLNDGHTYISDLGSKNGTRVNAVRIESTVELLDGDVVDFADITTRYHAVSHGSLPPPSPSVHEVEMNLGALSGEKVAVAGRDVNFFERRDSFLRDVASTRSKATWLLVLGFFLFVAGFATFVVGLYKSAEQSNREFWSEGTSFGSGNWLGPEVGGVPIIAIGYGVAFLGIVLATVGLVLHIVAAARKRSFESAWLAEGRHAGYLQ